MLTGETLDQIQRRLRKGNWWYESFFADVGYAFAWKMLPSTFGLCSPEDDVPLMMAYCQADNIMKAYDSQLEQDKIDRMVKSRNRGGRRRM